MRHHIHAFKKCAVTLACGCALALNFSGCGSKQKTDDTVRHHVPKDFTCLSERWAEPPEDIGGIPSDREPDARDVDPFESEAFEDAATPNQED